MASPRSTTTSPNIKHYDIAAKDALAPGKHTLDFDFTYDGGGFGKGGTGTLSADGKTLATGRIEATMPFRFSLMRPSTWARTLARP